MIDNDLSMLFYLEVFRLTIGFLLLIPEFKRLGPTMKTSTTLSLVGILVFYNFIFLTRALGIGINNSSVRQYAPAISGLLSAICLIFWGSIIINLATIKQRAAFSGIVFGIVLFVIGAAIGNIAISVLGLSLFVSTMVIMILLMYSFVFKQSPYIQARYRMFLMAVAITIMVIFEGSGVIAMRNNNYDLAIIFFFIEIVGRFTMTLSILLPYRIKLILGQFIH